MKIYFIALLLFSISSISSVSQVKIIGDTLYDIEGKIIIINHPTENNKVICKQFFPNGKLKVLCSFITNENIIKINDLSNLIENNTLILDGDYVTFDSDGDSIKLVQFKYGENFGRNTKFFNNGNKMEELLIESSWKKKYISFYPNGNKRIEFQLENFIKNGDEYHYYEDGKLKARATYKRNQLDGEFLFYDNDGSLKSQQLFRNDKPLNNNVDLTDIIDSLSFTENFYKELKQFIDIPIIDNYLKEKDIDVTFVVSEDSSIINVEVIGIPDYIKTELVSFLSKEFLFKPEKYLGTIIPTKVNLSISNKFGVYLKNRIPFNAHKNNDLITPQYDVYSSNLSDNVIYTYVENMPEFPGGMENFNLFLKENIRYPEHAQEKGIQGRVFIMFIVNKNGEIMQPSVARSVHPLLDAEAIRVINSMPKWIPGKQNGKNVKVQMSLPINFKLE